VGDAVYTLQRRGTCKLLASALSGGGPLSEASREPPCIEAARRTPHSVLLMRCLARAPSGDGTRELSHDKAIDQNFVVDVWTSRRWISTQNMHRKHVRNADGMGLTCRSMDIPKNRTGEGWNSPRSSRRPASARFELWRVAGTSAGWYWPLCAAFQKIAHRKSAVIARAPSGPCLRDSAIGIVRTARIDQAARMTLLGSLAALPHYASIPQGLTSSY
jgi:hypothetical protein